MVFLCFVFFVLRVLFFDLVTGRFSLFLKIFSEGFVVFVFFGRLSFHDTPSIDVSQVMAQGGRSPTLAKLQRSFAWSSHFKRFLEIYLVKLAFEDG